MTISWGRMMNGTSMSPAIAHGIRVCRHGSILGNQLKKPTWRNISHDSLSLDMDCPVSNWWHIGRVCPLRPPRCRGTFRSGGRALGGALHLVAVPRREVVARPTGDSNTSCPGHFSPPGGCPSPLAPSDISPSQTLSGNFLPLLHGIEQKRNSKINTKRFFGHFWGANVFCGLNLVGSA